MTKVATSIFLFFFFQFISFSSLSAQDFMMQGWYWDYPKGECGAAQNWATTLNGKAAEIGNSGITYVWLPPASRASFGACSNGYDPQDLYDLGEYGQGPTGLGTRAEVDALITALTTQGVNAVADVVFNHRDGGDWENNPAVENYVLNYPTCGSVTTPYPINGKMRYVLPLGTASGNTAGDYYFKFSSASGDGGFQGREYKLYFQTNTTGWQNMPDDMESEPNGGGDCGQPFNDVSIGVNMVAVEETTTGCNTDEFKITLTAGDINSAGDTLYIYMEQVNGSGTGVDIRPYGVWSTATNSDIIGQLRIQTRTDFTTLPSGQGAMNYLNFKPNGIQPTCLVGDIDFPYFFFDIEEDEVSTQTVYKDFAEWLWTDAGFRGFRMDAVKHFEPTLVTTILNHLDAQGITPGMVVGEYFDTSPTVLKDWVNSVSSPAGVDVRAFDFALRSSLKDACDAFGYDVRNVFNSGMVDGAGAGGNQVITFINNHDYREAGQPVQNDPMLGYAYILTNNQVGLPSIFYPDYFGDVIPNAPTVTLKTQINQLIEIHQDYIFNSNSIDKLSRIGTPYSNTYNSGFDNTTLLYQLSGGVGGAEIIVAINFAGVSLNLDHGINMTNLSVGDELSDLVGNAVQPTTTIGAGGIMHIELPARSYAILTNAIVPLPLILTKFEGEERNGIPNLSWRTQEELNVKGFEIERSMDGINFQKIGFQPAQNNSLNQYSFLDIKTGNEKEIYYRLKMIDLDGSFEYSNVVFISILNDDNQVSIFPNPFSDNIFIEKSKEGVQFHSIELFDIHGSKVLTRKLKKEQTELSLQNLRNGIFILKISDAFGEVVFVERVVKF